MKRFIYMLAAFALMGAVSCQPDEEVAVHASFTTDKESYDVGDPVVLTNTSTAENALIAICKWELGKGVVSYETTPENISYDQAGEYVIKLTVTSDRGAKKSSFEKTIRVVDNNIGLDMDVSIRCNGEYSYKIADPMLFYTHVCGNVEGDYKRSEIDSMLKTEFISALQPAFARISELEVRPSALPAHAEELSTFMNETLSRKWGELRGLQVVSIAMNPISLPEEDAELIKQAQRTAMLRDPSMAAATLTGAQAEAMKTAAGNKNGAMMGFMGMGMAQQAGGLNAQELYAMGQQQKAAPAAPAADGWKCSCGATATGNFCPSCGAKKPQPAANGWTCTCGQKNTGKFCSACGKPRPAEGWTCACGTVNQGKFCQNRGAKKPANEPQYRCDKCGWQPEDPRHPPKFCPECGDPFDFNDQV